MTKLFTVGNTYVLYGRGLVLEPRLPTASSHEFQVGEQITLVPPTGDHLKTTVASVEYGPSVHRKQHEVGIEVGSEIDIVDVPPGTEVWLTDDQ